MARSTRSRVSSRTEPSRLMTRDTVLSDTLACLATSRMVAVPKCGSLRMPGCGPEASGRCGGGVDRRHPRRLSDAVAQQTVEQNVEIAGHHHQQKCQLEIDDFLEVHEQLRDQRAARDPHDQQRGAELGAIAEALD